MSAFKEFCASLESMGFNPTQDEIDVQTQNTIGSVFKTVTNFLTDHNLVGAEAIASIESIDAPVPTLTGENALLQIGAQEVIDLCQNCNIPSHLMMTAVKTVGNCINNYSNGYDLAVHLDTASPAAANGKFETRSLDTIYTSGALEANYMSPEASIEAFGTYVNNTITDAKVAVTVSLLRFHRSALHRLIPNIPYDSNVVMFKVDHLEMYDLTKSRSLDSNVRNEGDHLTPFVDLYRDPSPANTTLKPILLHVANDAAAPNNKLYAENLINIGEEINMFDYSIDAGTIGYQNIDYTDLVGDNVRIKALYLEVTDGSDTEVLKIETLNRGGARLVLNANNADSADRSCTMRDSAAFDVDAKQSDGTASVLLAGLTPDGVIKCDYNVAASTNLRTSLTAVLGSADFGIVTKSGNAVVAGDTTLFGSLTFTLVAAEIDAHFSEENIRKTTKSMRILTKQVGYEIPGSNNVMVQYSLTQSRPETVIDGLTKLLAIGADDRGINVLMDNINSVFDAIQSEKALAQSQNYTHGVGQAYVAGQRVKPAVYLGNIDLNASVANMRSGELWGDIRGLFDKYLMEITVRLHNESYYRNEIGQGEKPVYSVLTSGWIMAAIMNTPHYVSALDLKAGEGDSDSSPIEFRRILPNGVHLHVVTTTFDYMTDKMMLFPVRPSSPRSVLNFARNAERGTYVANAAISQQSAVFRQLIANAREIPIVTSPIAALVEVAGVSNVFNGVGALGV